MLRGSEFRRNGYFAEVVQQEVISALGGEVVRNALGDSTADALKGVVQRMYIPNVRNDRITAPRRYRDTDHIPLLALEQGHSVEADETLLGFTPAQRSQLAKKFRGWKKGSSDFDASHIVADTNAKLIEEAVNGDYSVGTGHRGRVFDASVNTPTKSLSFDTDFYPGLGKENARVFRGRPIVVLGTHLKDYAPRALTVLAHEAVHVTQVEVNPTLSIRNILNDKYRHELEAYHMGAVFGSAVYLTDGHPYQGSALLLNDTRMEDLRVKHASDSDPFYPSPILKAAINEMGIDIL